MKLRPFFSTLLGLSLLACHRVAKPVDPIATPHGHSCEIIALDETDEIKNRCNRLFEYREVPKPHRKPVLTLDRCARSPSGNSIRYGLIGQTNRKDIRRVFFISAGLQGIFVNNRKGGRPNALTGQPEDHEELACDAPVLLHPDSLLSVIWNDPQLFNPQDTLIVSVFVTGGRIKLKDLPDNHTMIAFWNDFLASRLDEKKLRSITYAGMSLGGTLALGLASQLDDLYPHARHIVAAMAPVGRLNGWVYPVDKSVRYENPAGKNAKGVARVVQRGWYAHHLTDRSLWSKNVRAAAWLSGAPKVGYHEAWSEALGPIRWNNYTHDDMGSTFHPEVQMDQASFIRQSFGLPRYKDPVLVPESKLRSQECIERSYLPAWEKAYERCLRRAPESDPILDGES